MLTKTKLDMIICNKINKLRHQEAPNLQKIK